MYPFGQDEGSITQAFQSWPALVPPDEKPRIAGIVATAYVVGVFGGALWGGWKGLLAGVLGASALANGIGATVYVNQPNREVYSKPAWIAGGVSLLEAGLTVWLSRKVVDQREDEGRSAFGLAH